MTVLSQLQDSPTQWTTTKEEALKDALQDGTLEVNTAGIQLNSSQLFSTSGAMTARGAIDANTNAITNVTQFDYNYAIGNVSALGSMGSTETIDWSTASHFTGTLDADITITHSNEGTGQKITLLFAYDGSAQRTITWSHVDKWIGGAAPTTPSAAGEVLTVTLIFDGTNCYGDGGIVS